MKNFIIVRMLRWIIDKFDGKKTVIGFIALFCRAVLGGLRVLYPETVVMIPQDLDEVIEKFGEAFLGVGIGHKIHKVKKGD